MRVALVTSTYWPEVRRGAERLVHDLAAGLASRGHQVTVLTTHRARTTVSSEDGFRVVRSYRLPDRPFHARSYNYHLHTVPTVIWRLRRGAYDVAHVFQPAAAWAAVQAHRLGGPPVVFSLLGAVTEDWIHGDRVRLAMLRDTVARAAATTVLSASVAESFTRFLGRAPTVMPGGVFCADFEVEASRSPDPSLICAASLNDPRKNGELLMEAFAKLRERRPDGRLVLAGRRDPMKRDLQMALPDGAQAIDGDRTEDLARAYASSWASVLAAVDEAFGLVLIESLASGTPAVAARSGGPPEIIDDAVGRLFEPGDRDDLVRAMDEALELATRPGTAESCRRRAREFDWSRVLPRYEELYRQVGAG
jgi:glycosyltransferase involved in cell wall biosynthesis